MSRNLPSSACTLPFCVLYTLQQYIESNKDTLITKSRAVTLVTKLTLDDLDLRFSLGTKVTLVEFVIGIALLLEAYRIKVLRTQKGSVQTVDERLGDKFTYQELA